jgi:hypothetical protein
MGKKLSTKYLNATETEMREVERLKQGEVKQRKV